MLILVPALVALAYCFVGGLRSGRRLLDPALLVVCLSAVALGLFFALSQHDSDVPDGKFVEGTVIAVVALVPPAFGYYALGRGMRHSPFWLAFTFAVTLIPLYYFLFAYVLFVSDLLLCLPEQYQCPL